VYFPILNLVFLEGLEVQIPNRITRGVTYYKHRPTLMFAC